MYSSIHVVQPISLPLNNFVTASMKPLCHSKYFPISCPLAAYVLRNFRTGEAGDCWYVTRNSKNEAPTIEPHLNHPRISGPIHTWHKHGSHASKMSKHYPIWSQILQPTTRQALAPSTPMPLLAKLILLTHRFVIKASARAWLNRRRSLVYMCQIPVQLGRSWHLQTFFRTRWYTTVAHIFYNKAEIKAKCLLPLLNAHPACIVAK